MFNKISEVMELVEWAQSKGLKRLKIEEVEFEFSDVFIASTVVNGSTNSDGTNRDKLTGSVNEPTDDELLYMSAR